MSRAEASVATVDRIVAGPHSKMRAVLDYVALIGPGQGTVLITGESGTGKEVVARAIHAHSPRRNGSFVPVSCALFADSLIESELFGHERGAFTGALQARTGRFERAEGGTLFLDDIDDVPLTMQVKLLRALQNRRIERLGGTREVPIDVRIVAGTKRDLRHLVRQGRFREDLYYRLNVLAVDLPPLRERREDLPLLVDYFLGRFFARRGEPVPAISGAVTQAFMAYDWPGNVRELENACERIAETCTCGEVGVGCVAASVLFHTRPESPAHAEHAAPAGAAGIPDEADAPDPRLDPDGVWLDEHLRKVEASLITWALGVTGGNKSRAAELLHVKRSTLGDRIQRCGAEIPSVKMPVAG